MHGKFAETGKMQLAHLGTSPSLSKIPTNGAELVFKDRPLVFYVYDGRFGISYFNFGTMAGFVWVNDPAVYGAVALVHSSIYCCLMGTAKIKWVPLVT